MGLSTAERTGSPVLHTLWSYVVERSLLVFLWNLTHIFVKVTIYGFRLFQLGVGQICDSTPLRKRGSFAEYMS
jgi:hypothetical protein